MRDCSQCCPETAMTVEPSPAAPLPGANIVKPACANGPPSSKAYLAHLKSCETEVCTLRWS